MKKSGLITITMTLALATSALRFKDLVHHHSKKSKLQKDVHLQEVVVKTKNGSFRGAEIETFSGIRYYSFQGIPFAKPPIEELRFKPPKSCNLGGQLWDATRERSPCLQFHIEPNKKWSKRRLGVSLGSENCLYLNINTPQLPRYLNAKLLPVMVWVHGGGFLVGGTQQNRYSPEHFINEGVVMVAINYRLGAFGFLTTGDNIAPSNNGLRDQVMALKWIQSNIQYFCGDAKRVTLFGQSAGAASISYLLLTRQAKNLFSGAIMQSGTSLCTWALSKQICPVEKFNKMMSMSAKKVLEVSMKDTIQILAAQNPINGLCYGPVAENNSSKAFFYGKSHDRLRRCEIENLVPVIIGFNAREEDPLAKKMKLLQKVSPFLFAVKVRFNRMVKDIIPTDMRLDEKKCDKEQVATLIRDYYNISKERTRRGGVSPNLMRFIGDNVFVKPISEFAKLYSACHKGTNTFAYEFSYDVHGVGHGDELPYLFIPNKNDSVYLTAKRLVKMWTNFAKTGNPTPIRDPILENVLWPSMSKKNSYAYLEIGNHLSVRCNCHGKDVTFWNNLYRKCGAPPFDTY